MTILCDSQIEQLAVKGMISPFEPKTVRAHDSGAGLTRVVSYGLSSYGYDARLATTFRIFSDTFCSVMDPKNPPVSSFIEVNTSNPLVIPPRSYVLAHTIETFDIPPDVMVVCLGKSTYARSGLLVNVTPLEPCWRGQVTLELANLLPIPTTIYPTEGVCQFLFYRGTPCRVSYEAKGGKYQDQKGIVLPRM